MVRVSSKKASIYMVIMTKRVGNVPRSVKICTNTKEQLNKVEVLQFKSFEEHSLDKKNLHFSFPERTVIR